MFSSSSDARAPLVPEHVHLWALNLQFAWVAGPECPGDGKHKIASFLRTWKNSREYQPNKRHCLYGLDADLVMLSLVTHEPHFYLLRELVSFVPHRKGPGERDVLESPDNERFVLCQIG